MSGKETEPEVNSLRAVLKELKCGPLPLTAVYYREAVELAEKMKRYLDENFRSNITNQFLAERFGFVGSYLSSIFKSYYAVMPALPYCKRSVSMV